MPSPVAPPTAAGSKETPRPGSAPARQQLRRRSAAAGEAARREYGRRRGRRGEEAESAGRRTSRLRCFPRRRGAGGVRLPAWDGRLPGDRAATLLGMPKPPRPR